MTFNDPWEPWISQMATLSNKVGDVIDDPDFCNYLLEKTRLGLNNILNVAP